MYDNTLRPRRPLATGADVDQRFSTDAIRIVLSHVVKIIGEAFVVYPALQDVYDALLEGGDRARNGPDLPVVIFNLSKNFLGSVEMQ